MKNQFKLTLELPEIKMLAITKVRDTIEEVSVYGFLMNNIKFMPHNTAML